MVAAAACRSTSSVTLRGVQWGRCKGQRALSHCLGSGLPVATRMAALPASLPGGVAHACSVLMLAYCTPPRRMAARRSGRERAYFHSTRWPSTGAAAA